MTEQPTIQDPRTATELTPEMVREMNDHRVQEDMERRERMDRIDRAFSSPEAQKIRRVVEEDGNATWTEFVKHCGGILEVVAMVDEYGRPDTDQIIPKVDEIHAAYVQRLREAGHMLLPGARNRPYVPGPGTAAGERLAAAKRADREPGVNDAERLLAEEAEAAERRAAWHSTR